MSILPPSQLEAHPLDAAAVRRDFPILETVVHGYPLAYLDNAASTQRPRQVTQRLVEVDERYYANVHRGIHQLSEECTELYEGAREAARAFLGAHSAEEIIFTGGTTAAINLVARSWGDSNLKPGDVIVLSEMEHHSNLVPWQQLARRTGAVLRHIPITDDGQLVLESFDALLSGPPVKLVAVTAISNALGTINPVARIARQAHEAGALVLVDAAQAVPHQAVDVQAWGVDFLAFSGHKMLGPSGVGVLYGRRELLERMPPFLGGGGMIEEVFLDRFTPGEVPARFEAGTPPIVPAIGLAAAFQYLERVGMGEIQRHEAQLVRRAHEVLGQIAGVRIVGPSPELKASIVSFVHEKYHPHDIAQVLNDHGGIAVRAGHHCTQPLHGRLGLVASTRASFYLYNTLDEVNRLSKALLKVPHVLSRHARP